MKMPFYFFGLVALVFQIPGAARAAGDSLLNPAIQMACHTAGESGQNWKFTGGGNDPQGHIYSCAGASPSSSCQSLGQVSYVPVEGARPDGVNDGSQLISVRCDSCDVRVNFSSSLIALPASTIEAPPPQVEGTFFVLDDQGAASSQQAITCRFRKTPASPDTNLPANVKVAGSHAGGTVGSVATPGLFVGANAISESEANEISAVSEERMVAPTLAPAPPAPALPADIVCVGDGSLDVRNSTGKEVLFTVKSGEPVAVENGGAVKVFTVGRTRYNFEEVKFPNRKNELGWVAREFVSSPASCHSFHMPSPPAPVKPAPVKPPVVTPPPAKPPVTPPPVVKPPVTTAPSTETCAEQKIVSATKTTEAKDWGNRPESGGQCALGVRESLQASGVGDIVGGQGNGAVDYLNALPKHGYVDTGIRDPNLAPPGAVIVFVGADTPSYFKTGKWGSPAGNWLGHITIKGGDGWYYTDARTKEPAIGWVNGKNVEKIRNVGGIFVPGPALTEQYASQCGK